MRRIVFIYILCIFSVITTFAVRKHALIIGLGKQKDSSWAKINGDKDAIVVKQMLLQCGFKDIRTIINERATKQGIAQALLDITKSCKSGDIVYIHYSGHGQLMTDLDGDEAKRWTGRHSKWDESWIPYNAYMYYNDNDHGEKHFTDDEVARYLLRIRQRVGRTGEIYVVVDACHSGDATRGTETEAARGIDAEFVIPRKPNSSPNISRVRREEWLTISACRPYQLCFEQSNPVGGKLTFALALLGEKVFRMSNKELQSELQKYIDSHPGRLPQNPMVTGKR